jgi:hypothetical protein
MSDGPQTNEPPRPASPLATTRARLSLVLGVLMVGLGGYVALRPLWAPAPLTGERWTDIAFATFFLLRGGMYLRSVHRRRGG